MRQLIQNPTAATRPFVLLALLALLLLMGLTGCAHNAPGHPVSIGATSNVLAAGADLAEMVKLNAADAE